MDADFVKQIQEFIESGKDAYTILGLQEPPPDATQLDVKKKIGEKRKVATEEEKKELSILYDLLAKNKDATPKYNEYRKDKNKFILEKNEIDRQIEENIRLQQEKNQQKEREQLERNLKILEEQRLENERRRKENEERLQTWLIRAKADDAERRTRQKKMIVSYAASIVLSIVGAYFLWNESGASSLIIYPWILVLVLTALTFKIYKQNLVAWAIIALFIVGAVIWIILAAGAFMDISGLFSRTIDNLIGSILLVISCLIPILPIFMAFISLKMSSDSSVAEAKAILIKVFGER